MGSIASLDSYVNLATGGGSGVPETIYFHKSDRIAGVAAATALTGKPFSLWRHDGQPTGGVAPGTTARIPTNATAGGLQQADPTGGRNKWLTAGGLHMLIAGGVTIYDRLLDVSGLSGTVTSAQTVGGTMSRYNGASDCVGNIIFVEIYTAVGTTLTTITANYTNQDNASGQITRATNFGSTNWNLASQMFPLQLAVGDTGVRAVASVTVLATTGTAGDFGVTVARPLCTLSGQQTSSTGSGGMTNLVDQGGPPDILVDACLAMFSLDTTVIPRLMGWIVTVEA